MSSAEEKPAPFPTATSMPFWRAAAEGRLDIQFCPTCKRFVYYPRPACPGCLGELQWRTVSGRGHIYSFTIVHRPPSAAFSDLPYPLALVDLEEGPRLAVMVDARPGSLRIGVPVTIGFERRGEYAVPVARLTAAATTA